MRAEPDVAAALLVGVEQVGHDLLLRVHPLRHAAVVRRIVEEEVLAAGAELAAVVHGALGAQAVGEAEPVEQFDRAALQQAGAGAGDDLLAAVALDHHGRDTAPLQEVGEHQAGRACSHDGDGRLGGAQRDSSCVVGSGVGSGVPGSEGSGL